MGDRRWDMVPKGTALLLETGANQNQTTNNPKVWALGFKTWGSLTGEKATLISVVAGCVTIELEKGIGVQATIGIAKIRLAHRFVAGDKCLIYPTWFDDVALADSHYLDAGFKRPRDLDGQKIELIGPDGDSGWGPRYWWVKFEGIPKASRVLIYTKDIVLDISNSKSSLLGAGCKCPLHIGPCFCGIGKAEFVAEMKAKDRVYNQWTKSWVKK